MIDLDSILEIVLMVWLIIALIVSTGGMTVWGYVIAKDYGLFGRGK